MIKGKKNVNKQSTNHVYGWCDDDDIYDRSKTLNNFCLPVRCDCLDFCFSMLFGNAIISQNDNKQ